MYKDIISYELADGIDEEHLLDVAGKINRNWMSALPGFIKWEIHRDKEGKYTDIVYWESLAHAKDAEQRMGNIPGGEEWFACYRPGTISSNNIHLIADF